VFGHAKQGASYGRTKIAGRQILRKGLSPLVTTISTVAGAPVIAGVRLRAGKAGSGKGAASMVRDAVATARAAGAVEQILVRGDSAYGNSEVVNACLKAGVMFSVVLAKNPTVAAAIAEIPDDAWTPVQYPGAVLDPDTGQLIADAEVAEVSYTAFASTKKPVSAGWSRAASATKRRPMGFSPSGGITRSSRTRPSRARRPTSPTASTRSSRPCSPI
jgi:Transposase DDE domain group 1